MVAVLRHAVEVNKVNPSPCTREVKLIPIGDSKGIRIPKELLDKYGWSDVLLLEECEDGVVLRGKGTHRLSWEDTYRTMAVESEDWSDFDAAMADGVD